jgi:molecular chaperone GrpE
VSKKNRARTDRVSPPEAEPGANKTQNAGVPVVEEVLAARDEALRERAETPAEAAEPPPEGSETPREAAEGEGPVAGDDRQESEPDKLRAELEAAKDRLLRSQAELENYRKRVARQTQEHCRYANMTLIRDLLPVWDNIGRAIEAAEKTHDTGSLLEGFQMVSGQLESVLEHHHCKKIEALHEPFNPNLHEAISQQPSREYPANTVLCVARTGFRLHDRVVRPSQVIVSAALPETVDRAETANTEEQQGGEENGP